MGMKNFKTIKIVTNENSFQSVQKIMIILKKNTVDDNDNNDNDIGK